jgi:hypothetical protein
MNLIGKYGGKMWTGFIWLRIETSGGLLWTRQWTFKFHKRRWMVNFLTAWVPISFSRRPLLHGVSFVRSPIQVEI